MREREVRGNSLVRQSRTEALLDVEIEDRLKGLILPVGHQPDDIQLQQHTTLLLYKGMFSRGRPGPLPQPHRHVNYRTCEILHH